MFSTHFRDISLGLYRLDKVQSTHSWLFGIGAEEMTRANKGLWIA